MILDDKKNNKNAFSFMELAMSLVVISVLIVGIAGGTKIIESAKLSSAQSATKLSPIPLNDNLALWFESSLNESFDYINIADGNAVDSWNDMSNKGIVSNFTFDDVAPTYVASGIGKVRSLSFPGDSNSYASFDCRFLNNVDYTIIITEQRATNSANNYFFGDYSVNSNNGSLLLGYNTNGTIIHSQAGTTPVANSNVYSSAVPLFKTGQSRTFVFTSDANGKKTYINGYLAAISEDTGRLFSINTCYVGKGYNGLIGEIAIYTRSLTDNELGGIFNYQQKKVDINSPTIIDAVIPSCVNGIVDNGVCQ